MILTSFFLLAPESAAFPRPICRHALPGSPNPCSGESPRRLNPRIHGPIKKRPQFDAGGVLVRDRSFAGADYVPRTGKDGGGFAPAVNASLAGGAEEGSCCSQAIRPFSDMIHWTLGDMCQLLRCRVTSLDIPTPLIGLQTPDRTPIG